MITEKTMDGTVRVEGGIFQMGISSEDALRFHMRGKYFLTHGTLYTRLRPFRIQKHPVTEGEYIRYCESLGIRPPLNKYRPNCPMVGICRDDAERFAQAVGGRLPTAVEWEQAMRGSSGAPFPWGWQWRSELRKKNRIPDIGSYPQCASPYGVEDALGVVANWTSDIFDGEAIVKGSSCVGPYAHLSEVTLADPEVGHAFIGFRCAFDD